MNRPSDAIWYLYGVVATGLDLAGAPPGLDQAPLVVESADRRDSALAALVSVHDAKHYSSDALERNSADVEWLGARARAHDEVLTWASDRGAVVPMPMFTLFRGREAVLMMLRQREPQLRAALARAAAGREYVLRVYRMDAELLEEVVASSERLAELRRAVSTASPGQRYLLERKLEAERKSEARAASQRAAADIFDALVPHSVAAMRTSPASGAPAGDAIAGALVLDAAFLVASAHWSSFQRALSGHAEAYRGRGFRFDFTGPWPPYHFVRDAAAEGEDGA